MKHFDTRTVFISTLIIFGCSTRVFSQVLLNPLTQPQFVNPLPIPAVVDARAGGLFSLDITQFEQNLGLVNPMNNQPLLTKVWGYNGTYPGPTIITWKDRSINVFWNNKLVDELSRPLAHLLRVDTTIMWALSGVENWQQYGVPVVTHLHGGHSESASDGLPDAWFTPNFSRTGPGFVKGDRVPYTYSNSQAAATLWYHDHALGITRLNAYAGLAGFYIITDQHEADLKAANQLPASPYDIGLAIQDKSFTADGQLYYPSDPDRDDPSPSLLPETFGDIVLVNGMAWPVLDVEPRQYRFRIVNGSDSRFYNLFLSSGQDIFQIASDDGLLELPVKVSGTVLIAPGERKEIIIDFSNSSLRGQTIIVRNTAKVPYPRGSTINPRTTGKVMAFRVSKSLNKDFPLTQLPARLRSPIARLTTSLPPRKLILFESTDSMGRLKPMLGTFQKGVLDFDHPVTENPALNSTEIWEIYNETEDAHPIHLHQVQMQLLSRQKFFADIDAGTGKPDRVRLIGNPEPPSPEESGWKDTYIMYPGVVTRVIANFDLPGRYVWHCHILSHEDHEMMRPFFVGPMVDEILTQMSVEGKSGINLANNLLLKAYPNPFNTNLTLELTLAKSARIVVNLYDIKGSRLQQLQNAQVGAGNHQFEIDGTGLENGTYICEVMVDQQRMLRKLILQK
jgi:spore coat protein A, manganese oxidase